MSPRRVIQEAKASAAARTVQGGPIAYAVRAAVACDAPDAWWAFLGRERWVQAFADANADQLAGGRFTVRMADWRMRRAMVARVAA